MATTFTLTEAYAALTNTMQACETALHGRQFDAATCRGILWNEDQPSLLEAIHTVVTAFGTVDKDSYRLQTPLATAKLAVTSRVHHEPKFADLRLQQPAGLLLRRGVRLVLSTGVAWRQASVSNHRLLELGHYYLNASEPQKPPFSSFGAQHLLGTTRQVISGLLETEAVKLPQEM